MREREEGDEVKILFESTRIKDKKHNEFMARQLCEREKGHVDEMSQKYIFNSQIGDS